ncbi:MAG TPA: hypothetical protein H9737_03950 [Candidatus Borkfalkia faecigallinarum]|uniref:Uncharacterized protein n=1 Tax=Candidatus Borkfalkia faecigallinarum TaxID=2838509 RepID=A0A9D2ARY0_9FIRM|nr:hypothetical protein [Candidatus Borkfalkia faecigallinarum]
MSKRAIKQGKWQRIFDFDFGNRDFFTIATDRYKIVMSGGSVSVSDSRTGEQLFQKGGFHYLYTGDVSPDENVLAALENGKHFYIFSLQNFGAPRRVTLPRGYESIDGYPSFSADGDELMVPASIYRAGEYHYFLCKYDTAAYHLLSMEEIGDDEFPFWPV